MDSQSSRVFWMMTVSSVVACMFLVAAVAAG
jgi:hypothetical protein